MTDTMIKDPRCVTLLYVAIVIASTRILGDVIISDVRLIVSL